MGKFRIGSGRSAPQTVLSEDEIEVEIPKVTEIFVERRVEIPVIKEISVEIQKPVFKVVETEEKVEKPKIIVEEVPQTVIKPVFSIKQETVILDQLQKKLDETLKLAQEKADKLNEIEINRACLDHQTFEALQVKSKRLELMLIGCMVLTVASIVTSILW